MNLSISVGNYLEAISSNTPTPGGGNVSAFCGGVACSLGIMVCNLTIGKKKYADVEGELIELKKILEEYKEDFLKLAQKDNEAFKNVITAFKLPKATDNQISLRNDEIEKATLIAAMVPAKVLVLCRGAVSVIEKISRKGNSNSVSDAGVAISLLNTASQGAFLNVLINYSSLINKQSAENILISSELLLKEIKEICATILNSITNNLNKQ